MNESTDKRGNNPCCKVGRLIGEYELSGNDERLVQEWQGENGQEASIRGLTVEFNKQLLQAALNRENVNYLKGEVDNTYRLLTDDDVTEGVRVNVRRALKRSDVEIEAVEEDFISHQTLYNHLTHCLGASKPQDEAIDPVDKSAEEMFALQNRTVAVVDSKLNRLNSQDHLALNEFDVFVDIQVFCRECKTPHHLGDLLRNAGCSCLIDD